MSIMSFIRLRLRATRWKHVSFLNVAVLGAMLKNRFVDEGLRSREIVVNFHDGLE